jgi:hypothetical protein
LALRTPTGNSRRVHQLEKYVPLTESRQGLVIHFVDVNRQIARKWDLFSPGPAQGPEEVPAASTKPASKIG